MTTERQIPVTYRSTRPLTIALAIIAFAIGMVAGAIAVRALDLQADAAVRPRPSSRTRASRTTT